jgi:hypothetical protein
MTPLKNTFGNNISAVFWNELPYILLIPPLLPRRPSG